MREKDREVKIK